MRLTYHRCQCPSCRKYFNSTGAFESHRTGSHRKDTRRCLSADEMLTKGMSINGDGWWITEAYSGPGR